ncbi:MAG: ArsB/NhaD family transporter [Natronosporangium sp.]
MHEAAAVSALAVTLSLALRRPVLRFGLRIRVGPGIAAGLGVLILVVAGDLRAGDLTGALAVLWRPLLALASIMVLTGVAARVGLFRQLAGLVLPHAGAGAPRLFGLVFALSLATAAVFNNDAAILVLTPVVVVLVRELYPDTPYLLLPFAFAVFMAAGVAPFLTSNPMNTVMAGAAGIDFNSYASRMVPVATVAAAVTYLVLRWVFATELRSAPPAVPASPGTGWTGAQRSALALVLAVLVGYPAAALAGLHVYVVAGAGAVLALALAWRHRVGRPVEVLRSAVAWEIIVFLLGMFVLAKGLQNVGVVERLRELYEAGGGTAVVGVTSAAGSALINNHSMALANLLAIQHLPGAGEKTYLAALVGGDLGPRVLPIGSLAGLLWLTLLGRLGVELRLRQFVVVGTLVTVPSLAASLGVLALL